jgi:type I restriction enzyme S subunit
MSWPFKPLSKIFELSGQKRAGDQDLPLLSITMKYGLVDQSDKFKKRIASLDTANYRIAYHNELVVGFPIDEGVLGFQIKYPAGIVSPAYDIWKLKDGVACHIPYLERYLRSSQARQLYVSRMRGAVARRRSLTKADFLSLEIPFPDYDNQVLIAHLLGKVESLIAQHKQQLKQLDELLKSVFLEMFGDPIRNEKGWEITTIGALATDVKYGTSASAQGGAYKYLRMNNITPDGYWDFDSIKHIDIIEKDLDKYSLKRGDLVFNRTNSKELVGKTAVYNQDEVVVIAGYLIRVRFDSHTNPWYVWGRLNSNFGKTYLFNLCRNIVGMANINAQELKSIPILKPPIELQNSFAAIVQKVEDIKLRYQQSITELESLYDALSQQAFKGDLDLSKVTLPEQNKIKLIRSIGSAVDNGFASAAQQAMLHLNQFNSGYSETLKNIQSSMSHLSALNNPALKAIQTLSEQASIWRSPLDELKNMPSLTRAFDDISKFSSASLIGSDLQRVVEESSALSKKITDIVPTLNMDWLKEQQTIIDRATVPYASMQTAIASLGLTDNALSASYHSAIMAMPDMSDYLNSMQAQLSANSWLEQEPKHIFTHYDILDVLDASGGSISSSELIQKLSELELITLDDYERIKGLLFGLLNDGEIDQRCEENRVVLFRVAV